MDEITFLHQFTPTTYGVLAILGVLVLAVVKNWAGIRVGEDTILGNRWKRLTDRLTRVEDRCDELEVKHAECLEEKAEERAGRLKAEALLQAKGEITQRVARVVAADRAEERGELPHVPIVPLESPESQK